MTIEQIRAMKTEELHQELEHLRHHLFNLRAQAVTEKLEDPTQLGKTRRDIARLLTVMSEKKMTNVEQRQAQLSAQRASSR